MQTVPERIAAERTPSALSHLYLVVALLAAIALSILTPPFLVSDEGAHAEREISIAHGYWLVPFRMTSPRAIPSRAIVPTAAFRCPSSRPNRR